MLSSTDSKLPSFISLCNNPYISYSSSNINENNLNNRVAVVVHGSGQPHWDLNHPVVLLLFRYGFNSVYSITLPYHSTKNRTSRRWKHSKRHQYIAEELDIIYQGLIPLIKNQTVCYVAYSVGAGVISKGWTKLQLHHHSDSFAIFIGAALATVHDYEVQELWMSYVNNPVPAFIRLHGKTTNPIKISRETLEQDFEVDGYQETALYTIDAVGRGDNGHLLTKSEREEIFGPNKMPRIYFISGHNDQYCTPEPMIIAPLKEVKCNESFLQNHIFLIDSKHFDYFKPSHWPKSEEIIKSILSSLGFKPIQQELRAKL